MEREQDHFASAHKYTRRFLRDMEAEGYFANAAVKNPRGAHFTQRYYTEGHSLEQIALDYVLAGERIRQVKDGFMKKLLDNSDPYYQSMYQFDSMPKKNDSPYSRFQQAFFRREPTAMVAEAILTGARRDEIMDLPGINYTTLSSMYDTLKSSWGIEIDHIKEKGSGRDLRQMLEDIEKEEGTKRLRELFLGVDNNVYLAMRRYGLSTLTMIGNAVKAGGYHISGRELSLFIDTIDNINLPPDQVIPVGSFTKVVKSGPQVGIQTYYFTKSSKVYQAIAAWRKNPDLDMYLTNPVRLVAGPVPEEFPTTSDFNKKRYLSLYALIAKLGYQLPATFKFEQSTLDKCPAPIFIWSSRTSRRNQGPVYDPKYEEELIEWFKKALPEHSHN